MSAEIHDMFASIAPKYDFANDVLSMGIHRLWRQRLVHLATPEKASSVLDLCTGTGDLAFAFARRFGSETHVIGLDFVGSMLERAVEKLQREPSGRISFLQADATAIPFPSSSFDIVCIAFGIRNIPKLDSCLSEVLRVLKPNGRFFVLEFGQVKTSGFKQIYDWYGKNIMPLIGKLITGNKAAYEYLPKTSRLFPAGEAFSQILADSGFTNVQLEPLLGGMAYIYEARRPQDAFESLGRHALLG